jgi:group II intron reverse transcriptase/maturase
MLEPKPVGSVSPPKPLKILSKTNLRQAWDLSRDSTSDAGGAGIDNVSARQFASNLDVNLDEIAGLLHAGRYKFSRLRPAFIRKPNSDKERVICIPTVRDRIVQKAIVNYLTSSKKLPIYNASSFGFIKGQGTRKAIEKAVELRSVYEWCVKADIEAFFDQVPRDFLRQRVSVALQNHSLVPLISDAVGVEIRGASDVQARAAAQGISIGRGIRQGMPLSPMLANLVLSKFDRAVEAQRIPMVRYADDLLLFFGTKEEARIGKEFVEQHLMRAGLKLAQSKTAIYGPDRNISFLGLEIAFLQSLGKYVARVSRPQIRKIQDRLETEYSYVSARKSKSTLSETTVRLSRSIAAYLGVYKNAQDYITLATELERTMNVVLTNLYSDIFGIDVCEKLDDQAKHFLGLDILTMPAPPSDLDW